MTGYIPYKAVVSLLVFVVVAALALQIWNSITQNDDLKNLTVLVKETKAEISTLKNEINELSKNNATKQDIQNLQNQLNALGQKVDSLNLPQNITNNILNYVFNLNFILSIGLAMISLEFLKFALGSIDAKFKPKIVGNAKLQYWNILNNQTKVIQTVEEYKLNIQKEEDK